MNSFKALRFPLGRLEDESFTRPMKGTCRSLNQADPGLLPLMTRAAAIIVNRGGLLSHGAIVARQFNLPAVAVSEATTALASGTQVVVDGERGVVLIHVPDSR